MVTIVKTKKSNNPKDLIFSTSVLLDKETEEIIVYIEQDSKDIHMPFKFVFSDSPDAAPYSTDFEVSGDVEQLPTLTLYKWNDVHGVEPEKPFNIKIKPGGREEKIYIMNLWYRTGLTALSRFFELSVWYEVTTGEKTTNE